MSENEQEVVTEETEEEETQTEETTETTDWEARAKELERKAILQRARTKELRAKLTEVEQKQVKPDKTEKKDFDYGELSYLEVKQVPEEEHEFLLEEIQFTGKSLKDILKYKYVQEELKTRKESRVTKESLPSGGKRTGGSTRDSADYWLAKGELPPADQVKLRREVVRAKIKAQAQQTSSPFG